MKQLSLKKISLPVLISLVFAVSFFSALITPIQTVSAAPTNDECYKAFGAESNFVEIEETDARKKLYNECKSAGFCSTEAVPADHPKYIRGLILKCKNSNSISNDTKKKAADAEVKPLVKLLCGDTPTGARAIEIYQACATEARTAYSDCNMTGGSVTSSMQDTDANTAACIKKRVITSKKVAAIKAAVTQGRSDGAKIVDDEIKEKGNTEKKEKCEADGKIWEDGECVEKEDESSCKIDGIGWIVCPVMTFIGNIVDTTYVAVEKLMTVPPMSTDTKSPLYNAWAMSRNFANITFVMAFLVIIYSQITGMGLNNYGIKKMLPKIIVAVVLVNISYWLCAIAVDISNVAGSTIKGMFDGITASLNNDNAYISTTDGTGGAWTGAIMTILAATGVLLWVGFSVLAPLSVAALAAVVTVVIVLVARQAIIIFLIVMSPLAFVAFLLPNTQKWFDRWKDSLLAMLLMFPIIGLLFGASQLASYILASTAGGQITAEGIKDTSNITNVVLQLAALGVAVIPLILAPFIIKLSTGILGKVGAFVNNPNRGPIDKLRKSADGYRGYRKDLMRGNRVDRAGKILGGEGKVLGGKYSRRRKLASFVAGAGTTQAIDRDQKYGFAKAVADESSQGYLANRALNDVERNEKGELVGGFAMNQTNNNAGKAIGIQASAQSAVDKIQQQDTMNRVVLYEADVKIRNNPEKELQKALDNGDEVGIRALGTMLMKGGSSGYEQWSKQIQDYQSSHPGGGDDKTIEAVRKFTSDNGKDFIAKDPAAVKWAKGVFDNDDGSKVSLKDAMSNPKSIGRTDEQMAGITSEAMRHAASSGAVSVEQAKSMLSNPQIVKETSIDNQNALRAVIASGGTVQVTDTDRSLAKSQNNGVLDETKALKHAIDRLSKQAPSVEQIQNNYASSEVNIELPKSSPNNSRTSMPEGTSGYQKQGSLYLPKQDKK